MMMFDPVYLLFMLPALILAGIATLLTKTTFAKYSHVYASSGMSGAEAARHLLDAQGLYDVKIERTSGFLGDHYDPRDRTLRLSPDVYGSNSLSAVGVACHEAGHALQHAQHYAPLALRTTLVPVTQFGSNAAYIFILIGLFVPGLIFLAKVGVILFGVAVLFAIITLPVEWDASSRAKKLMISTGIVDITEQRQAGAVLNAAFMTYIAAAVSAILTFIYYLFRLGLLGGRSND